MEKLGPRSVKLMQEFVGTIKSHQLTRALDVAGGDGRFSGDLLLRRYEKTDLFDQRPVGAAKAQELFRYKRSAGKVCVASMEHYRFAFKYTGIYMIWCSGYLSEEKLVEFLKAAKKHLCNS